MVDWGATSSADPKHTQIGVLQVMLGLPMGFPSYQCYYNLDKEMAAVRRKSVSIPLEELNKGPTANLSRQEQ
jgi:hypothetical protein